MKENEQEYINGWREALCDIIGEYDREFDNKIVYIGAGALALLLIYGVKEGQPNCAWQFIAGVLCFALSALMNLGSFLVSKTIARYYLNIIDRYDYESANFVANQEKTMYRIIYWYNLATFVVLIVGIISSLWYVMLALK